MLQLSRRTVTVSKSPMNDLTNKRIQSNEWELRKENAAPMIQGRSTRSLNKSLSQPSSLSDLQVDPQIQSYETLLKPSITFSSYFQSNDFPSDSHIQLLIKRCFPHDKDPLQHWLSYIKYLTTSYPSNTHAVFLLYERCTNIFLYYKAYYNDTRYIRIIVLYADQTSNPKETFQQLYSLEIGRKCSLFYLAWAWRMEKENKWELCSKIYEEARKSDYVQPKKVLEERYHQFERRMARYYRQLGETHYLGENEGELLPDCKRKILERLGVDGMKQNIRGRNGQYGINQQVYSNSGNKKRNNNIESNGKKYIFQDEPITNVNYALLAGSVNRRQRWLVTEKEKRKENTLYAEALNERRGYINPTTNNKSGIFTTIDVMEDEEIANCWASQTSVMNPIQNGNKSSKFEVYVDEECSSHINKRERNPGEKELDGRTLRQKLDGTEISLFYSDPNQLLQTTSFQQLVQPTSPYENLISIQSAHPQLSQPHSYHEHVQSIIPLSKTKQASCGFDKTLVSKGLDGHETSFEECRAVKHYYTLISSQNNFNFLHMKQEPQIQENESFMDVDEESDDNIDMSMTKTMSHIANCSNIQRTLFHDSSSNHVYYNTSITKTKKTEETSQESLYIHSDVNGCPPNSKEEDCIIPHPTPNYIEKEDITTNTIMSQSEMKMLKYLRRTGDYQCHNHCDGKHRGSAIKPNESICCPEIHDALCIQNDITNHTFTNNYIYDDAMFTNFRHNKISLSRNGNVSGQEIEHTETSLPRRLLFQDPNEEDVTIEETINTKLAAKELSKMFISQDVTEGGIIGDTHMDQEKKTLFSVHQERYPGIIYEDSIENTLNRKMDASCISKDSSDISSPTTHDGLRVRNNKRFHIYCDENENSANTEITPKSVLRNKIKEENLSIYCYEKNKIISKPKSILRNKSKHEIFDIYCDHKVKEKSIETMKKPKSVLKNKNIQDTFDIYCNNNENNDTMKNPKLELRKNIKQEKFDIYCDDDLKNKNNDIWKKIKLSLSKKSKQEKFSIHYDNKMKDENNEAMLNLKTALRSKSQRITKQKNSNVTFQTNDRNSNTSIQTPTSSHILPKQREERNTTPYNNISTKNKESNLKDTLKPTGQNNNVKFQIYFNENKIAQTPLTSSATTNKKEKEQKSTPYKISSSNSKKGIIQWSDDESDKSGNKDMTLHGANNIDMMVMLNDVLYGYPSKSYKDSAVTNHTQTSTKPPLSVMTDSHLRKKSSFPRNSISRRRSSISHKSNILRTSTIDTCENEDLTIDTAPFINDEHSDPTIDTISMLRDSTVTFNVNSLTNHNRRTSMDTMCMLRDVLNDKDPPGDTKINSDNVDNKTNTNQRSSIDKAYITTEEIILMDVEEESSKIDTVEDLIEFGEQKKDMSLDQYSSINRSSSFGTVYNVNYEADKSIYMKTPVIKKTEEHIDIENALLQEPTTIDFGEKIHKYKDIRPIYDTDNSTVIFGHRPESINNLSGLLGEETSQICRNIFPTFDSKEIPAEIPCFGNISKPLLESNLIFLSPTSKMKQNRNGPTNVSDMTVNTHIITYDILHNRNIDEALRETMCKAEFVIREYNTELPIFDRRRHCIPSGLRKTTKTGFKIDIDGWILVVKHELGRGTYGTVLLCHSSNKATTTYSDIALKVQIPTGSLAWEFKILHLLEHRMNTLKKINKNDRSPIKAANPEQSKYPFPSPLSFVAFKDGGVLGMTAGSSSGLNLVDIVNIHRGSVPELIAIYYTSRMLLYLEFLHASGKILHCDVKPDNWVLTQSCLMYGRTDDTITGSDLMLVDFGRSIDLIDACSQATIARSSSTKGDANEHPLNVQFRGDVSVDGEAYVRMRHGQTWGYELDMYGICASSHVLLFGEHIQIEQDIQSKHYHWKLKRPFRRYWQKPIWTRFFDTLLNIKDADENMSSRLLKSLKTEFEQYLQDSKHQAELRTLLASQARVLPKVKKSS